MNRTARPKLDPNLVFPPALLTENVFIHRGRAVQVDPITPKLKGAGT
jgi:hypothetical protein